MRNKNIEEKASISSAADSDLEKISAEYLSKARWKNDQT